MKSKIAILTLPLFFRDNYGGIIQNYALQKILKDLGHDVTTINRIDDNSNSEIKVGLSILKAYFFRNILQSKNPKFYNYQKVAKHNLRFLKEQINLSPVIKSSATFYEYLNKNKFDAVIVGSDQVWRPKYSPNIFNFYLDVLQEEKSVKKMAYAASFGTEKWEYTEEQTKICSKLAQKFDAISVREDSALQLCSTFLSRKDAILVLDPTLLLDSVDYNKLINIEEKKKGLFTYLLDFSTDIECFVKSCSEYLKLETFSNQAKYKTHTIKSSNIEDYIIPPIEGWLQGFRDADFVITDSFHGTVFAIINRKPFIAIVNEERGSSRFESILNQLGLKERLIFNIENFDMSKLESDIDYDIVNFKLNHLKAESLNFIKNNI